CLSSLPEIDVIADGVSDLQICPQPERATWLVDPFRLGKTSDHRTGAADVLGIGAVEQVIDTGTEPQLLHGLPGRIDRENAETGGGADILSYHVTLVEAHPILL